MSLSFGASKSGNYDGGLSIPSLPPGIYHDVELEKVEFTKSTKKDGENGKNILTFLFKTPQGYYQRTEWEVLSEDKDAEKKAANLVKRVEHIMRQFVGVDVIESNPSTTFEQYGNWVVNILSPVIKGVKDLEIKIIGNVWNGKATSDFPNYVGFIARKMRKTYKPLSFSAQEIAANKEYIDFISSRPDTENEGSTSGPSQEGFNSSAPASDPDF